MGCAGTRFLLPFLIKITTLRFVARTKGSWVAPKNSLKKGLNARYSLCCHIKHCSRGSSWVERSGIELFVRDPSRRRSPSLSFLSEAKNPEGVSSCSRMTWTKSAKLSVGGIWCRHPKNSIMLELRYKGDAGGRVFATFLKKSSTKNSLKKGLNVRYSLCCHI